MAVEDNFSIDQLAPSLENAANNTSLSGRSNALANKLSSVLASSYADSEIRDALHTLDESKVQNTSETRRRLRIDAQKEVIDRNGDVIQDFGQVAEVNHSYPVSLLVLNTC